MIELHYGALLDAAHGSLLERWKQREPGRDNIDACGSWRVSSHSVGALELYGIYLVGRDVLDAHIANTTPVTPAQVKQSLDERLVQSHTRLART
jgi:hypothetical protein